MHVQARSYDVLTHKSFPSSKVVSTTFFFLWISTHDVSFQQFGLIIIFKEYIIRIRKDLSESGRRKEK